MIPKILHWGSFGPWTPGPLNTLCFDSWAQILPDYEARHWTDLNGPDHHFFQKALKERPINAHNFIGLYALYHFGGVMLDNDVEVLRPFDMDHGVFVGFQRTDSERFCINNAVIGATPRHPFIRECLRTMRRSKPHEDPLWFGCGILTDALRERGLAGLNVEQKLGDIMVYDRERFYPFFHDERPIPKECLTARTFAIHHWQHSWKK